MELIVAVYDSESDLDAVERRLQGIGIPAARISRYRSDTQGGSTTSATSTATVRREPEQHTGFWSWLLGDSDSDSRTTEERSLWEADLNANRHIIRVECADHEEGTRVQDIMIALEPESLDRREEGEVSSSTTSTAATQATGATAASVAQQGVQRTETTDEARTRVTADGKTEEVIPLAEEKLEVGKRAVQGTTTVRRYTVERPVEASVNLRDEHVTIERRAASGAPARDLSDKTVEVTTLHEEPVVSKEARIVEEAVIRKEGTERTETVEGVERKEEIEIEKGTASTTGATTTVPTGTDRTVRTTTTTTVPDPS